jgi:RNA polymerase sigma factor (sigma-70 family)
MVVNDPLLATQPRPEATVAQAALFRDRKLVMTRLAFLLTGSVPVAEELVQDAFEQVVRRWELIEHPQAYLRLAVINGARSWGRRRRPAHTEAAVEHPALDADAIAVRDALAGLQHDEREVLVLRYYAGMTDTEVAGMVDRPIGTVKSQIYRGLARMREVLR